MGINNLAAEFQKEEMQEYYQGLFPIDNPTDLRFAINYYTAIGLGKLTEQMREVLAMQEDIINERKRKEEEAMAKLLLEEEEEMMKMILDEQKVKEEENRIKEEGKEGAGAGKGERQETISFEGKEKKDPGSK